MPEPYQTPDTISPDEDDHIWGKRDDGQFECIRCKCVTDAPPPYPTPTDWRPPTTPGGRPR